ncbi:MAG: hypothetical protein AAF411_15590 [Myxococcota bacterium]
MRLPEVYVVFANEWRGVIRCANDAQELDRSFAERLGSGSVALAGSTLRALMLPGLVLFLVGWTFGLIGLATTELAILAGVIGAFIPYVLWMVHTLRTHEIRIGIDGIGLRKGFIPFREVRRSYRGGRAVSIEAHDGSTPYTFTFLHKTEAEAFLAALDQRHQLHQELSQGTTESRPEGYRGVRVEAQRSEMARVLDHEETESTLAEETRRFLVGP